MGASTTASLKPGVCKVMSIVVSDGLHNAEVEAEERRMWGANSASLLHESKRESRLGKLDASQACM